VAVGELSLEKIVPGCLGGFSGLLDDFREGPAFPSPKNPVPAIAASRSFEADVGSWKVFRVTLPAPHSGEFIDEHRVHGFRTD
jgi:hypothetical protein